MSQERTGQRWAKRDIKIAEKLEADMKESRRVIPNYPDQTAKEFLEIAPALRYWIEKSDNRYDDRTATAAEFAEDADKAEAEIDRLNAVIAGQAGAIKEQTAKVQDRDTFIERLRAEIERLEGLVENQVDIISAHDEAMRLAKWLHERDTREIKRLRAAMDTALAKCVKVDHPDIYRVEDVLTDALKGAE